MQVPATFRSNGGSPDAMDLVAWLKGKCAKEGLSSRAAADKTGLSHGTIASILRGKSPTVETIEKLAKGFSASEPYHHSVLKDYLLTLAGYRDNHDEDGAMSEPLARLMDKVCKFDDEQLEIMEKMAELVKNGKKLE